MKIYSLLENLIFSKRLLKSLFVMKLIVFLMTFSFMHVCASVFSQKVTISGKNIPIEEVFNNIENQTGVSFFYRYKDIKDLAPVSLDYNKVHFKTVLDAVFKDLDYEIQVEGKTIIINRNSRALTQNTESTTQYLRLKKAFQKTITGRVTNSEGRPLAGVTIRVKGSQNATTSNDTGDYSIMAEEGQTLVFTILGYVRKEVNLGSSTNLNLEMKELVSDLDEVIVTGYISQSKREITGSISTIKSEEVSGAMTTSVDGAMQGRMSGVNVQSSVGVPGAGIRVRIRGAGSISAGNDPIYVLDGVVFNTTANSRTVSTNPLSTINPDDILSIEVLKDAAAASVYGAQAANGVVLITTKSGQSGKTNVNFSYRIGEVSPVNLLDVLSSQDYLNARFEAVRNGNPSWNETQIRENVLRASKLSLTLTDQEIAALPTYDWQRASYRSAISNKYDLSVDGGNEKSQFRLSAAYEDTDGSIIASGFKRGTMNFNYANQLGEKVKLNTTVNLSSIKQTGPLGSLGTTTQFSAPSYASPMMLPFVPIYLENGDLNVDYSGFPGTFKRNIVHSSLFNEHIDRNNSVLANFKLNYQILENLSYRLVLGLDYRDGVARNYYDPRTSDGYNSKGILQEYDDKPVSFTNTHVLTYEPQLAGEHRLKTLGGLEYYSYSSESAYVRGQGFPTYAFDQMQSAALITAATSSWTGFKRIGSFVQANYTFGNRFMASGIVRYDGSSRFGVDNQFGLFPALSAGWDLAEESLFNDVIWLNQLKLRVGYGETGNDQIGNFASRSLFGGGVSYDGESGISSNSLGNKKLRWERNATTNIGIDYSFFNHRLIGAFEVYQRKSKDLLLSRPVAWAGGYSSIVENLGEVSNKGIELEVGGRLIDTEDFKWKSSFNITFQKNQVDKLYDNVQVLPGDESVRVGYSLLTHVLTQYGGVNPATGKAFWYDQSGNPTYSPSQMTGEDFAPHGLPNGMPTNFGGYNNQFSYKGLALDVFFQYDYGRVLYNNMGRTVGRKGDSQINTSQWYYDNRWINPGQITTVPRPINNAAERGSSRGDLASTRYLEDASYIRLKNISLSYDIPTHYLNRIKLSNAKLKFQANNIFTLTKFSGYDPEFNSANTGVIPLMKSYFLGVQVSL